MSAKMKSSLLPGLATLRDLLDVVSAVRGLSDPFGSLDDLRSALQLLERLGTTLQLNPKWLAWLQSIYDDAPLLEVLLAVGHYVENLIDPAVPAQIGESSQPGRDDAGIQAVDFSKWLSLFAELLQLIQQLRGQQLQTLPA
jgi:hypothetical protein